MSSMSSAVAHSGVLRSCSEDEVMRVMGLAPQFFRLSRRRICARIHGLRAMYLLRQSAAEVTLSTRLRHHLPVVTELFLGGGLGGVRTMISRAASETLHTRRANAVPFDYKLVAARGEHIARLQDFVPAPSDRPSYDFKFRPFTLRFDYKRRATLRVSTAELTAARAADGGLPRPARRRTRS